MIDFKLLMRMLAGKQPPPKVTWTSKDDLYEAGATRGTLIIGDPGVGKTRYAAMQIFKKFKTYPEQAIFVFDWSGSLTNTILELIIRDPDYQNLLRRVVLDELGHPEWVCPKPEFHKDYGLTNEEQVSRITENMERLAAFMAKSAPFLVGTSIEEIGKELLRLLSVITNEHGESWQITEGKRLLIDTDLLTIAVKKFGHLQPAARWFFVHEYLSKEFMKPSEKELSTKALRYILGKVEGREVRATLGYYRPGWTPKEATERGLLILIDAHRMINQPSAQHYLLMQNFSLVMAWINKREVDDPSYHPAMIAFDETYTILRIPGMAEWLGMVSPLYRSRKFQLLIIIQALWQLDKSLAQQIWTLGNVVSFAVSNGDEALKIAKQLFSYEPRYIKNPPKTETQNATTESLQGQDRLNADWIQNLKARELVMRRFITEQTRDPGILYIPRTANFPSNAPYMAIQEVKEKLITERGVRVRDALEIVNKRDLIVTRKQSPKREHLGEDQ
jgi:hypothetical protein